MKCEETDLIKLLQGNFKARKTRFGPFSRISLY